MQFLVIPYSTLLKEFKLLIRCDALLTQRLFVNMGNMSPGFLALFLGFWFGFIRNFVFTPLGLLVRFRHSVTVRNDHDFPFSTVTLLEPADK